MHGAAVTGGGIAKLVQCRHREAQAAARRGTAGRTDDEVSGAHDRDQTVHAGINVKRTRLPIRTGRNLIKSASDRFESPHPRLSARVAHNDDLQGNSRRDLKLVSGEVRL